MPNDADHVPFNVGCWSFLTLLVLGKGLRIFDKNETILGQHL